MADNDVQVGADLQIVSYGKVPGMEHVMQFMINASFGRGLFEALTLTVLVPSGADENANRIAALTRAKELAGVFSRHTGSGHSGEITIADERLITAAVEPPAGTAVG